MPTYVYREQLDTHPALQAALAAAILLTAYLSLNPPGGGESPALGLAPVLVVTVTLLFNFRALENTVTGESLTA